MGARHYFARHVLGWTCTGSAVFGVVTGLTLSVFLLDRFSLESPTYVQRASLSGNGEAEILLALQVQSDSPADGEDLADLDTTLPVESPASKEVAGGDAQASQSEGLELVLADGQRVLGVDFDLGEANDHSQDLSISKPINLNGQALGIANLAIDQQSRLHVSSEDLSNLLPEELFARIDTGANFIGFDDLRAGGLDISYDPLADVIEIVT